MSAGIYVGIALAVGVGGLTRLNWRAVRREPWPSAALAVVAVVVGALAWPLTLTVGRLVLRRARLA